jgi:hypothetical protein
MIQLVAAAFLAVSTPLHATRTRSSAIVMMKPKWTENSEPLNVPGRGNVDVDRVVAMAGEEGKRSDRRGAHVSGSTKSTTQAAFESELAAVTTKVEHLSKDLEQHREFAMSQHNSLRSRLQQAMDERGSHSGKRAAEAQWRTISETVESIQSAMTAMEATLAAAVEAAALDREAIIEATVEAGDRAAGGAGGGGGGVGGGRGKSHPHRDGRG